MTEQDAIRFLCSAAVEYAMTFAKAQPTVSESMMVRVQEAAELLRPRVEAVPNGDHQD